LLAPSLRLSFFLHTVFFTAVVPKKKSSCLLPSFHPHPSICLLLNQLLLLLLFASSLGMIHSCGWGACCCCSGQVKTGCVALVLCLNVGVDPPDVIKVSPCARMECWIGLSPSLFTTTTMVCFIIRKRKKQVMDFKLRIWARAFLGSGLLRGCLPISQSVSKNASGVFLLTDFCLMMYICLQIHFLKHPRNL